MDKSIKWDKNYDFAMLDMIGDYTDDELKEFGMTEETIKEFRKYQKQQEPQERHD